jgi:galactan 5-O-arabinofuranosyltransferase
MSRAQKVHMTVEQAPSPSPVPPPGATPTEEGPAQAMAGARSTGVPGRRLLILLPWLLVPVAVLAGYLILPGPSLLRAEYQVSAVALVGAPLLGWLLTRRSALAHHAAAALVAGVLPALTLIALHGTDWYFSGPFGDQSFRIQYATRFADDLSLSDYTYRDVPAFYSPGWFWVVGLTAHLTGLAGFQAYKWVAIGTLYLAALAAFALWRQTCGTRLSALLVTVSVIGLPFAGSGWLGGETLLFAGAYEPYAWLIALPLPALVSWFAAGRGSSPTRRGVLLGVALALAAWLYLLYALVAVAAVLVVVGWRWRDRARWVEVLLAGLTSVVLTCPWLGRFLVEWVSAGRPTALATSWLQSEDSYVNLITPSASPWVVLACLGAVGLIVIDGDAHRPVRGLQALGVAVLVLGVVQLVAGQGGGGVLFHRLLLVLGVTVLAGGTLTLAVLGPHLRHRLDWGPLRPQRVAAAGLTVVLFIALNGHAREWMNEDVDLLRLAVDTPYPDGTFSARAGADVRAQSEGLPSDDDLATAIRATARAAGQERTGVLLCDSIALLTTEPFDAYQQWWALYANPLGEYGQRRAFLERLASLPPGEFVPLLRSDADAPTVFALQGDADSLVFTSVDWNPSAGGSSKWTVRLPRSVFEGPDFVLTDVGPWTVAALRAG